MVSIEEHYLVTTKRRLEGAQLERSLLDDFEADNFSEAGIDDTSLHILVRRKVLRLTDKLPISVNASTSLIETITTFGSF
jgi:hypothetical protein